MSHESDDDTSLRPIRRGSDEPLFNAPWEAQAFAIAYQLIELEIVSREEWADALGKCIRAAQADGDPDDGDTYYLHVLSAVEHLMTAKGLAGKEELENRKQGWKEAYLSTPHGQPVNLES